MFDPYHKWLGISKKHRPPTHYQLLSIAPEETDPEVIEEAAVRQTAHVRTYQIGPHATECNRLLNEISQAKMTLLNPAKRKAYDEHLARAAAERVTTMAPLSSARGPEFDLDGVGDSSSLVATRSLNIAKPGRSARKVVWLAAGGVLTVAVAVVGVLLAMREPTNPAPRAVAQNENKKEPKQRVNGVEDAEANKKKPGEVKRPVVDPPVVDPPAVQPKTNLPPKVGVQDVPGVPKARKFRTLENHIRWLSLAPDGSKVAVGDVLPRVYDLGTGRLVAGFQPRELGGTLRTPVAFLPDNKRVLFAFGGERGAVGIGDAMTGKALFYLPRPEVVQYASCLAVDHDGKRALVGHNYRVGYWDLEQRKEIRSWQTKGIVEEVIFTPDGRAVTADDNGHLHLWDLRKFTIDATEQTPTGTNGLAITSDGSMLGAGSANGVLLLAW